MLDPIISFFFHLGSSPNQIDKQLSIKLRIFPYLSVLTFVLGVQNNCNYTGSFILSTRIICFGWELRKLLFYDSARNNNGNNKNNKCERTSLKFVQDSTNLVSFSFKLHDIPDLQIRVYNWKLSFFISRPKFLLWLLKRTVAVRQLFWTAKHMFKLICW